MKRNFAIRALFKRQKESCLYGFRSTIWFVLFVSTISFCQTATATGDDGIETSYFSILAGSPLVSNAAPLAVNATAALTYTAANEQSKKLQNIITLSLFEESPEYIPSTFTANVKVRIEYGANATTVNSVDQVLTIDYNKAEGTKYNAKHYFSFSGAAYVKVTVLEINAPMLGSFDTKKVLILQNEMRVTRYYALANNVQPAAFTTTVPTIGADELTVSWLWPATAGNTHTQLEWAWVEDELISSYYVNGSLNYPLLFKNNATRIDLPLHKTTYKIPLLYGGSGKLYCRIRAVNIKKEGSRSDGPWSAVQAQPFTGHNEALNWQASTSFAEEGKRKAVVQYFDGSLRSRQTVTKENVNNTTVTAETLYDGQGRPAVQILPVPGINNIIGYTKNLNLFNGQVPNEDPATYFDLQPIATATSITPPLSNTSGAAQYYSAANPEIASGANKSIPDAEGYPYSVTRYTPDGTGRIMAQSGVGAAMQMGKGHETKYYYGSPAQEELDGLFGTEVGDHSHYFKNMVKDANGQMSVSYVDMHGRTIATALAGDAPTNTVALNLDVANYPNQAGTGVTRNLLNGNTNVVKNNSIESINTLLVPATTAFQFRYELNPESVSLPSGTNATLCYDCMYNLEITITDETGDTDPIVRKFNNINLSADDACATPIQPLKDESTQVASNVVTFSQTLSPGSYMLRKTLTLSEASLQKYREEYLVKGLQKTEQQLIDSVYTVMLTVSDCDNPPPANTCAACLDSLGTYTAYRATFLSSIGNPGTVSIALEAEIKASFDAGKLACDRLCNTTSQTLATKRQLMLADMMPYSGQYARETGSGSMYAKYNIFSTANAQTQPFYKKPWNGAKALDYYRTDIGMIDPVINATDNYALLNATTQPDFAQLFSYSWAEALLPHHPEYDKLQFAEANLKDSYNWITTFTATTTYSEAAAKGYLFTSDATLTDPLYAKASSLKGDMVTKVSSQFVNGLSLWQIAYGDAVCKNILAVPQRNACYTTAPKVPPFTTLTTAEKDNVWVVFRNLYATVRDGHANDYLTANVTVPDAQTLVNEGYLLQFPTSNNQLAQQLGSDWSWYPTTPGGAPNTTNLPAGATPAQTYSSRCSSYITGWRQALLNCPQLANHTSREQILNEMTAAMNLVCQKGSSEANPFGASNVAPSTPADGSPRSFEEVINTVLAKYGIEKSNVCNPFVIEFPKPYGKGPAFIQDVATGLDTCSCSRFSQLKAEAIAAGKNPAVLSSFNQYLSSAYKDTLTKPLYDALLQNCSRLSSLSCMDNVVNKTILSSEPIPCGCAIIEGSTPPAGYQSISCLVRVCDSTGTSFALPSPQPMPAFLKCGAVSNVTACLGCARLSELTAEFKALNLAPYTAGPVFTGTDLTEINIRDNIFFQQFVNYRTGYQYSWMEYAKAVQAAGCDLANYAGNSGAHQNVICGDTKPLTDTTGFLVKETPCQKVYTSAISLAQNIYAVRKAQLLADFEAAYRAKCMAARNIEQFTVAYTNKEYHYTLYYYDMAGSLVKTVPPKGVRPDFSTTYTNSVKTARQAGTALPRPHEFTTNYRYNSLGQVVAQHTPDAGTSSFWYDKLGRLAVSQNAQQALEGKYSYTLYDALGRITEVGQKPQATPMTQAISQDAVALNHWIQATGGTREQLTFTVYDAPYAPLLGSYMTQQNLRNRVSYTGIKKLATDALHYAASFYAYDIHGNVDTLLQDYKGVAEMEGTNNRFKRVTYAYDLVSGKVNGVSYQPGEVDAFYHRYTYDAENRLTGVATSRDSIIWERDAAYNYYKHGPLARTELGQLRVQGLDYAYTLQGWLKGLNTTALSPSGAGDDIGKDGLSSGYNSNVARDVLGFALHYYDAVEGSNNWQDYKAIGGTSAFARPGTGSNFVSLYNGNIGAISINNAGLLKGAPATTNALPLFYNYRYDQLNRLVSMQAYKGLEAATNQWNPIALDDYAEAITYDPNGNILTYNRNGAPSTGKPAGMDALTYDYYGASNKLRHVGDNASYTANYTEDIDDQSNPDNYTYDAIGNLKTDAAEGLTAVNWNVYGKISSIVKNANTISYSYDAAGNRITKTVGSKTTIYVRDAGGNVLSIYEKEGAAALKQVETHLYGSSRLGMAGERTVAPQSVALAGGFDPAVLSTFTRGEKGFELSNHLGNVLATVSDKKLGVDVDNNGTVDYYLADVGSASDYAPFGMQVVGRKYSMDRLYRYGFNGKEEDDEVKGDGNQQDYGLRIYDPRLGRFLSVDPLSNQFPWNSVYSYAEGDPINYIDLDGGEKPPIKAQAVVVPMRPIIESVHSEALPLEIQKARQRAIFMGPPMTPEQKKAADQAAIIRQMQSKQTTIQQGGYLGSKEYKLTKANYDTYGQYLPGISDVEDGANLIKYLNEGDYKLAAMSALFLMPGGDYAKPTKKFITKLGTDGIEFALKNTSRLQHAFKHAKDIKQFAGKNWNKEVGEAWKRFNSDVLETATKSFDNVLGSDRVKGFYKNVDGQNIATYIYKDGDNAGQIASTVVLNENQMKKFGLK